MVGGGRAGRAEGFNDHTLRHGVAVNCVIAQSYFGAIVWGKILLKC